MLDTTPLLSVRDLSIDFHLRTHILHAVRGVSFDLHKGRTLAVSEATLKDREGKLLAFGTETCSIFPAQNLAPR